MIRELIAKCQDKETRSVIADWCEEDGRPEVATWLRAGDPVLHTTALRHLSNTLEEPYITPASFHSLRSVVENLPYPVGREWLKWSAELLRPRAPPQKEHRFFVRSFDRNEDGTLDRVAWCFAEDFATIYAGVDHQPGRNIPTERLVPLAEIASAPCPSCRRTGLVVGCEEYWSDAAMDNAYRTQCYVLCMYAPHVETIGMTGTFWDGASI